MLMPPNQARPPWPTRLSSFLVRPTKCKPWARAGRGVGNRNETMSSETKWVMCRRRPRCERRASVGYSDLPALTAGIGFDSTNVSDVTLARASRVTPAVTAAQAGLSDAMAARDRECRGGVGKFCREREAAVVERRRALDAGVGAVEQAADPQADAAIKLIAWGSGGALRPAPEDFAMVRLILLALLPQFAGVLLMIGRSSASVGRRSA